MTAIRVFRRFRDLLDVTFGSPADGDVVSYDAGTDKLVMTPAGVTPADLAAEAAARAAADAAETAARQADDTAETAARTAADNAEAATRAADDATEAAARSAADALLTPKTRTVTAGAGLAGGGDLSADRTFDVNVDSATIEINADTLRVKAGGIGANEIAADAIGSSELADNAVDTNALQAGAVTSAKIADGTITVGDLAFDPATQAELDAHITDATDAHDASAISVADAGNNYTATDVEGVLAEIAASGPGTVPASSVTVTPAGGISSTDAQAALEELDAEKASAASAVLDGDAAGGVLSGTYPNPGFAVDMATQAELDAVAAAAVNDGDAAGGVLSGTYPNPGFAEDMATQLELIDLAAAAVLDGDPAGGVLSGTYPDPGFAADMATQAELDAEAAARAAADTALVPKSLYDANTVLKADSDNTPVALTMAASTILARLAAGSIVAATPSEIRTLLSLVIGTDVQAHDTDLDAIAALAAPNDDIVQRKAGAWTNRTIAQLLVDLAAAGTTFQPLDSDLTALAGLAVAADTLPYGSGSHTMALATFTSFARTLVDDADASAALSTLGVSTFIKTLLDDADAVTARATLGVVASLFQSGGAQAIKLDDLAAPDDNTDLNASSSTHGLLPKLDGNAAHYLDGTGAYTTPAGGSGSPDLFNYAIAR